MNKINSLYDKVINGNLTKEEFDSSLKSIRAFSREDRLKLQIIDASPFTIWACDIDYKICLWERRCQELYGYSKNEAINKSFVELFVAPDERNKAELDCVDIIKNNKYLINLAGDINKYNNIIFLMTNCFKVTDIDTGDDLQAEIGLAISNSDWKKLNDEYVQIIETNRKLISKKDKLQTECDEFIQECFYRISELKKDIRSGEIQAVKQRSHNNYKQGASIMKANIEICLQNIKKIISPFLDIVNISKTENDLESPIREFRNNMIVISDEIENIAYSLLQLQIEILSSGEDLHMSIEKTEVVIKRDSLLDIIISRKAELLNKIENKIYDYESSLGKPGIINTPLLTEELKQKCQQLEDMKDKILKYFADQVGLIKTCYSIDTIEILNINIMEKINEYLQTIKNNA